MNVQEDVTGWVQGMKRKALVISPRIWNRMKSLGTVMALGVLTQLHLTPSIAVMNVGYSWL